MLHQERFQYILYIFICFKRSKLKAFQSFSQLQIPLAECGTMTSLSISRQSMDSTRLTKSVIPETDFPPYFSIAGFDSFTVATQVLRDRGIRDSVIPTMLKHLCRTDTQIRLQIYCPYRCTLRDALEDPCSHSPVIDLNRLLGCCSKHLCLL